MKQRIVTGLLFALAVALFIVPGFWVPLAPIPLFIFVALAASAELAAALRHKGLKPSLPLTMAGSMTLLVPLLFVPGLAGGAAQAPQGFLDDRLCRSFAVMSFLLLVLMAYSAIGLMIRRGPDALPDAVANGALMVYIALPMSCPGMLLFYFRGGWLWLLVGLAAPWISDVFAYFTGVTIGRTPVVPRISPRKTLEGCLGGMLGSILLMPLIFWLFGGLIGESGTLSWPVALFAGAAGLLLSVASQMGDWLASGFKRWCGVKDFGKILPGHGGIMDRFDSAFFTLPVTLALAALYQVLLT